MKSQSFFDVEPSGKNGCRSFRDIFTYLEKPQQIRDEQFCAYGVRFSQNNPWSTGSSTSIYYIIGPLKQNNRFSQPPMTCVAKTLGF